MTDPMKIPDNAEYVGPIEGLRGKRARVLPDETYELPLHQRTLQAQFFEKGTKNPETGGQLWMGWHTFAVTDFKLLWR